MIATCGLSPSQPFCMEGRTLRGLASLGDWPVIAGLLGSDGRHGELTFDPALPGRPKGLRVKNGLAIIDVEGPLAKYAGAVWRGAAGASVQSIGFRIMEAAGRSDVRSILLRVESPGGTGMGVADLADTIFRANRLKPVVALADSMCAGSALWLASQAGRFYATSDALLGSVGAAVILVDDSRAFEKEGVHVHLVASGPNKATGEPGVPISSSQLEPIRDVVTSQGEMFLQAVLRGRQGAGLPQSRLGGLASLADGRLLTATEALSIGLVDEILPLRQVLQRLAPGSAAVSESPADVPAGRGIATAGPPAPAIGAEGGRSAAAPAAELPAPISTAVLARPPAQPLPRKFLAWDVQGVADDGRADTYALAVSRMMAGGHSPADSHRAAAGALPKAHRAWLQSAQAG